MESEQSLTLKVENLSFAFHRQAVLKDICCAFYHPELILVAGPNGAGKSTLLRLLGGILKAESGMIILNSRNFSAFSRREIARLIAYLPQNIDFPLHIQVKDLIYSARYPYYNFWSGFREEDHKIVQNIIEQFNLQKLSAKSILELSGGEQKRVLLATMAAQQTVLYLFDEPFNNLDQQNIRQVIKLIRNLRADRKMVIVVSHDLNYLWPLADRLLLLKDGKILYDGERRYIPELFNEVFGVRLQLVQSGQREYLLEDE